RGTWAPARAAWWSPRSLGTPGGGLLDLAAERVEGDGVGLLDRLPERAVERVVKVGQVRAGGGDPECALGAGVRALVDGRRGPGPIVGGARRRRGRCPATLCRLGGLALLVGDPVELGQELRGGARLLRVGAHLGERVRVLGGLGLGDVVAARRLLLRLLLLPRAGLGAVAAARLLSLLSALVLALPALLLLGRLLGGRLRWVPGPGRDTAADRGEHGRGEEWERQRGGLLLVPGLVSESERLARHVRGEADTRGPVD